MNLRLYVASLKSERTLNNEAILDFNAFLSQKERLKSLKNAKTAPPSLDAPRRVGKMR